jgi:hypothetical protein
MTDAKNSPANPRRLTGKTTDFFKVERLQKRRLGRLFTSRQVRKRDCEAWKVRRRLKPRQIQRRGFVYLGDRGIPALIKQ